MRKHTAIDKLQEARRIYDLASEASSRLASLQERLELAEQRARAISWALERPFWILLVGTLIGSFLGAFMAEAASNWYRWAENAVLSWWAGL